MFGSENRHIVPLTIDSDPGGTDEIFYMFRAPRDITITAAYLTSEQANNAGTAVLGRLENWGTAGTAVGGTVSSYSGGTTSGSRLSARTPAAMTLDSTEKYVDEGEWIVFHYAEEGAGWVSGDRLRVNVEYTLGKV